MPEPEILRRCAVCGAASRPGALFCRQCGNATTGTRAVPDADAADRQDAQDGQVLDPRLQTRKLDSTDPALQTRRLDSAEVKEPRRSESSESGMLHPGSASSRKRLKKKIRTLKSALQSTLAQKTALLQQGRHDEAKQLDSQIEKQQQALAVAEKKAMSVTAPVSVVEASAGEDSGSEAPDTNAGGDSGSEVPDIEVAVAEVSRQPDSPINFDVVTTVPPEPLEDSTPSRAGKLRNASNVVLEEATYDAGVRFVLVAAVLFVLFLVILLLSKMIT